MRRNYFKKRAEGPAPLRHTVKRRVRFEEVDPLGIVWHGRYASYFEDARLALSKKYDLGYMEFYNKGVATPLKKLHFDYVRPLRFDQSFSIEGLWHFNEAARIDMEFLVRDEQGALLTSGYSVQMMLDPKMEVLLVPPYFYLQFLDDWRSGELL